MAWVMWALPEVEADFLAIYGREVDVMGETRDAGSLSGPRFLNLCAQLPYYSGAVAAAALRWHERAEREAQPLAVLMTNPDLEVSRG